MFEIDGLSDLRSAKEEAADQLDEVASAIGDLSAKLEEVDGCRDAVVEELRKLLSGIDGLGCSVDEHQPDLADVGLELSAIDAWLNEMGA